MFFIYCIKNLFCPNKEEEISEEQVEDNLSYFSLSKIYELFYWLKNKLSPNFSFLSPKILIIRVMIFMAFFLFLFFLIKSIGKAKETFKNRNYKMTQKNYNNFKLKDLHTKQLINQKNIRVKKHLNISLRVEHSNYVHLQIDSIKGDRWRVPNEILNDEYFNTIDEKYSKKM